MLFHSDRPVAFCAKKHIIYNIYIDIHIFISRFEYYIIEGHHQISSFFQRFWVIMGAFAFCLQNLDQTWRCDEVPAKQGAMCPNFRGQKLMWSGAIYFFQVGFSPWAVARLQGKQCILTFFCFSCAPVTAATLPCWVRCCSIDG